MERRSLPRVSFGEIWIESNGRGGVFECIVSIPFFEVGGTAVGEVDVVGAVEIDGFGVGFDGEGEVAGLEGGVAGGFELFGFGIGHF